MEEVTELLHQVRQGDRDASARLMTAVYSELRQMADRQFSSERNGHTLQPTALVNETYLRLISNGQLPKFDSRAHFFAAAAEAMRRILIDSARARASQKRGGDFRRVALDEVTESPNLDPNLWLDLDKSIEALEIEDEQAAQLAKLRLYAGLSVTEAGQLLGMPRSTAYKNWEFVRSWVAVDLSKDS